MWHNAANGKPPFTRDAPKDHRAALLRHQIGLPMLPDHNPGRIRRSARHPMRLDRGMGRRSISAC